MPIPKELQHFYGREWRTVTRPRILAREGNRCKFCSAPNGHTVFRIGEFWLDQLHDSEGYTIITWRDRRGAMRTVADVRGADKPTIKHTLSQIHFVRIVLTVAHLNHKSGDDRDENLAALCQWCHLNYDLEHHGATRGRRKDAARPLLASVEGVAV